MKATWKRAQYGSGETLFVWRPEDKQATALGSIDYARNGYVGRCMGERWDTEEPDRDVVKRRIEEWARATLQSQLAALNELLDRV